MASHGYVQQPIPHQTFQYIQNWEHLGKYMTSNIAPIQMMNWVGVNIIVKFINSQNTQFPDYFEWVLANYIRNKLETNRLFKQWLTSKNRIDLNKLTKTDKQLCNIIKFILQNNTAGSLFLIKLLILDHNKLITIDDKPGGYINDKYTNEISLVKYELMRSINL
jgi:hypothetical protein